MTFSSIWKKREVYDTRAGLHGTNSATQRAIFFKCRELRRNKKIKSTWTQDLKIWIRENNDKKNEITTEDDLNFLVVSQSQPLPPPNMDNRTIPETPYTTPRPSPVRSLWSQDSSGSFHGFSNTDSLGNLPRNWLCIDPHISCFHFHSVCMLILILAMCTVCLLMFILPMSNVNFMKKVFTKSDHLQKFAFFIMKQINHGTGEIVRAFSITSNHG